jgi:hypothetical protein
MPQAKAVQIVLGLLGLLIVRTLALGLPDALGVHLPDHVDDSLVQIRQSAQCVLQGQAQGLGKVVM